MQKKDYELIASVIKDMPRIHSMEGVTVMVELRLLVGKLAAALASDNPRFRAQRFIDACYADMPQKPEPQTADALQRKAEAFMKKQN